MQGAIQKWVDHSISVTVNLPNDVPEGLVGEIYIKAWEVGCKGITVYRDGSRSGVLVTTNTEKEQEGFVYRDAVKRPKVLPAETHKTTCQGEPFNVIIGLLDGKPYEVFMDNSNSKYSAKGNLTKVTRGGYVFQNGGDPVNVVSQMTPEQQAITRLVSSNLRHGADIQFITEQLQKIDTDDMFNFIKGLARVLKKYIKEGAKSTEECSECGSNNLIYQEGCLSCKDCGSSKCG
jgi:ribonucleoside-diphosphate reductase alpha chain